MSSNVGTSNRLLLALRSTIGVVSCDAGVSDLGRGHLLRLAIVPDVLRQLVVVIPTSLPRLAYVGDQLLLLTVVD